MFLLGTLPVSMQMASVHAVIRATSPVLKRRKENFQVSEGKLDIFTRNPLNSASKPAFLSRSNNFVKVRTRVH